ncbi:protein-S-isoprenylcysteine carboxyl O-methyltransferase [Rhodotorula paludigena]|uniref:protein-S-isoprenylcysteine carboxyl O-methyltransferase n=1 Tax=Rhodotorula paludigena TaxID=86838 RepID=UPI0031819BC0
MSSIDASPPASPFEPRPAPATSADAVSSAAPPSSTTGVTSAKPMPVEFPLTSFASTPHNVACIAFLLGACWSLGLALFAANASSWFLWSGTALQELARLPERSLVQGVTGSPQLGIYLASWAFFHLLEFVVTSMYNPGKLSVSSYLLDNGNMYHVAHVAGILEHILEEAFLPAHYRRWKHAGGVFVLGLAVTLAGQVLRSFAMISASSNFSHLKRPGHHLVKEGIYSWSRHPSYAGFYWWAIGTQIMLGNPVCAIGFLATLQWFFAARIKIEERLLVKFFGQEYEDYRRKVPSRILFVP